jgi:hypothetical protein
MGIITEYAVLLRGSEDLEYWKDAWARKKRSDGGAFPVTLYALVHFTNGVSNIQLWRRCPTGIFLVLAAAGAAKAVHAWLSEHERGCDIVVRMRKQPPLGWDEDLRNVEVLWCAGDALDGLPPVSVLEAAQVVSAKPPPIDWLVLVRDAASLEVALARIADFNARDGNGDERRLRIISVVNLAAPRSVRVPARCGRCNSAKNQKLPSGLYLWCVNEDAGDATLRFWRSAFEDKRLPVILNGNMPMTMRKSEAYVWTRTDGGADQPTAAIFHDAAGPAGGASGDEDDEPASAKRRRADADADPDAEV